MDKVEVIKKLMNASEDEIVTFIFQIEENQRDQNSGNCEIAPKSIRVLKSMLMNCSPVFEAMFSANWDTNAINMKDDVYFNQYFFQVFLEVLLDLRPLTWY